MIQNKFFVLHDPKKKGCERINIKMAEAHDQGFIIRIIDDEVGRGMIATKEFAKGLQKILVVEESAKCCGRKKDSNANCKWRHATSESAFRGQSNESSRGTSSFIHQ